jgi:hypothetical protein
MHKSLRLLKGVGLISLFFSWYKLPYAYIKVFFQIISVVSEALSERCHQHKGVVWDKIERCLNSTNAFPQGPYLM